MNSFDNINILSSCVTGKITVVIPVLKSVDTKRITGIRRVVLLFLVTYNNLKRCNDNEHDQISHYFYIMIITDT